MNFQSRRMFPKHYFRTAVEARGWHNAPQCCGLMGGSQVLVLRSVCTHGMWRFACDFGWLTLGTGLQYKVYWECFSLSLWENKYIKFSLFLKMLFCWFRKYGYLENNPVWTFSSFKTSEWVPWEQPSPVTNQKWWRAHIFSPMAFTNHSLHLGAYFNNIKHNFYLRTFWKMNFVNNK